MSELAIVNVVHLITFCWVLSRSFSGRDAWRHFPTDASAGAIAAFTWVIIFSASVTGGAFSELGAKPLVSLIGFIVLGVVYVVLTYASVKIREYAGRR